MTTIDVSLVDPAICATPELRRDYFHLLSASEREQYARFIFPADRDRFLVTRALVRTELSRYASVDPRQWEFFRSPFGKPEAVNAEARSAGLRFNVSHTDGLVALVVATGLLIGVDVERVARAVPAGVAESSFCNAEVVAMQELPPARRQQRFWELWTLKESYIKARGEGLSLGLDQIAFDLSDETVIGFDFDRSLHPAPAFWQWRPSSSHVAAVCVVASQREGLSLCLRQVVPLVSEHTLEWDPVGVMEG